jgi:hypothetical protein
MRAYGRHLRSKWPFLFFSFCFTVLAVVNTLRTETHQLVLPWWAWALIALGCLNVAQFLAWRDLWVDDVEADHAEKLRILATRLSNQVRRGETPTYLDDALAAWVTEHMFRMHFPKTAETVASYQSALATAQQAKETLIQTVFKEGAFQRFGQSPGWSWGGIARRCETHLKDIIDASKLDIRADVHSESVVWTTNVVFNAQGLAEPEGAAVTAAEQLNEWVESIGRSPEADAYRVATKAHAAHMLAALRRLDPLVHGQRIRRAHRCQICFPPRRS